LMLFGNCGTGGVVVVVAVAAVVVVFRRVEGEKGLPRPSDYVMVNGMANTIYV
jgi:hypothetical protein